MFKKKNELIFGKVIEGVELGTMVHGEKTLMAQFRLEKGADLPVHEHMHEQTGLLISGRIVLTLDGVDHDVAPGDSWCIGAHVPHGARALEDSVAVEVFSPVREEYERLGTEMK
jgi:quercetin dioxygenase-like cupin family protein